MKDSGQAVGIMRVRPGKSGFFSGRSLHRLDSMVTVRGVDPLTHTVLGASLGYAVFHRRLGRTAAAVGALAALLPDADIFIRSEMDPLLAVEHHRGFTHALLFAPAGAGIVAGLWCLRRAGREYAGTVWACALLAYASHCLLDAATSYGTRLFWPLSDHRVAWDVISVIDPVFTVPLVIGLGLALAYQRVNAVRFTLALAAAYLGAGVVQHARALAAQETLVRVREHEADRRVVMPTLGNLNVWRALYEHDGRIHSDRIRVGWFAGATVVEGWSLPRMDEAGLTPAEVARNAGRRSFERFSWFSEGWVARSPADPGLLGDMRYSLSTEAFDPIWGIRFTETDADTEVVWVNRSAEREVRLSELWAEITGADPRYRILPVPRTALSD